LDLTPSAALIKVKRGLGMIRPAGQGHQWIAKVSQFWADVRRSELQL
jgi:hypothetical protein